MSVFSSIWKLFKKAAYINDSVDIKAAGKTIRSNISFRGPNLWILAFAIIIASVGLNINSTAVIIGAMLISPLMGPIFGLGLGLGINDMPLLKSAAKNLLIMVVVSLLASALYFLLSPLTLANPTELEARTNPTIFDLLIALFGGAAGIFEMCRKQKGTVISGVAIATALMPPICTAGYGLAHLNLHFLFGALYLFTINTIFITLSTYFMVKYLRFPQAEFIDESKAKKTRQLITLIVIVVAVPSCFGAFNLIKANNLTQKAINFVTENRTFEHSYIYDYNLDTGSGELDIFMGGSQLNAGGKERLLDAAEKAGLKREKIKIKERNASDEESSDSEKLMQGIYARTDSEINKREIQINMLEAELNELRRAEIPYLQISREVKSQYPELNDIYISRGARVVSDTTDREEKCILIVAESADSLSRDNLRRLEDWLKVRLADTTVTVINRLK
ncbi:MAG: DUF389 domain-containing protein [Bacteroidales bacterium]|nr:DUF389 domain-containing protein [Bacteroidales bacterium]